MSNSTANRLDLQNTALKLTFRGKKFGEVIVTKVVERTVTPRDNQSFETFKISPYMKENLNLDADVVNNKALQASYPQKAVLDPVVHCYGNLEMTLGHCVSRQPSVKVLQCQREVLTH